jgi:Xaa-Pro aminopeptidase
MVILYPDNPDEKYREVLVLMRLNEMKEKWDGRRLRDKEAKEISGIKTIVWLDNMDALLQKWIHAADTIYLNTNEHDRKSTSYYATRDYRFVQEMKERYPLHNYERTAKIMMKLRAIKTKYEVEVIEKAIDITDKTFRRLLGFIKPGVIELKQRSCMNFCVTAQGVRRTQALLQVVTGQEPCIIFLIMKR